MHGLIDRYCNLDRLAADGRHYTTRTRLVRVERGTCQRAASLLAPHLGTGPVAVFQDQNTQRIAGQAVIDSLRTAGVDISTFNLEPGPNDPELVVCDDETIALAERALEGRNFTHAIAVGAGTINDIVKMAASRRGIDYSVVATAPSMNGYTSSIAAILSDGVKTTQPCAAPIAALADPEIMAAAPYRMIASGLGDLYSKPVSNADWRLGHRLTGSFHSDIVMEIVDAASTILDGVAPRLAARDEDAVGRLTGAIMLSGLAMQAAGTSGPASGGEHLISHYIDMTAAAFGEPHDFHGCQVAVGTMVTSTLYDEVRQIDPKTIDVDARVAVHREWDAYESVIRERFGKLAPAVLPHARAGHPSRTVVRDRLEMAKRDWADLMHDVGATLRPTAELEAELRDAACPTRFDEIGVSEERALASIQWSKDIRARYTILHLAAELGVLDDFAERYVRAAFANR